MVKGDKIPYVSRGGLSSSARSAPSRWTISGLTCLDVGSSTGGFTDCMLQNGASKVYSVDVGYGQLAWQLRTDPRVVNLERTNARYLTREQIPEEIDFFSVDVSFISLKIILPAVRPLLKDGGKAVCLIKPQFEAGREKVGKKGVVRDKAVHEEVVQMICDFAVENGYSVQGLTFSPVKGPEGNIEYLVFLQKSDAPVNTAESTPHEIVEASHAALDKKD